MLTDYKAGQSRKKFFRKPGTSFSARLMLSFVSSVLIVMCMFVLYFYYSQNKALRTELIKEGKTFVYFLSHSSRAGVFAENEMMLRDAATGILDQKNVLLVSIYTMENRMLFHESKTFGKKTGEQPSVDISRLQKTTDGLFEITERRDFIEVKAPVILETGANLEESLYFDNTETKTTKNIIGYVNVVLDKGVLRGETLTILLKGIPVAALFLGLGILMIYWSVKRSTRHLNNLTNAVDMLGRSGTIEKVAVESGDEIGRLASAFNEMAVNLKKREEEKELLEEKLRFSQKMEAVGTFARGIAHDFNNILSTVKGAVFAIEKKYPDHAPIMHYIEPVNNALGKAKSLINGLVTFSRIQKISTTPVELNNLLRKSFLMIRAIAGDNIEVKVSFQEENLMVNADHLQMEQVIINLCMNAKDAMPDGGMLTISTRRREDKKIRSPEDKKIRRSEDQKIITSSEVSDLPGFSDFAEISVADTGFGMDEETKEKIFEPFFTTKEVGKGTGLGLAIVYGIIEQHKGFIEVSSKKGEGTEFRIYLPLIKAIPPDSLLK